MGKKKRAVVSVLTLEANLKRKVRSHLRRLGFATANEGAIKPPSLAKEGIRAPHQEQRRSGLTSQKAVNSATTVRTTSEARPCDQFKTGNCASVPRLPTAGQS